jgi:hypothetical protein
MSVRLTTTAVRAYGWARPMQRGFTYAVVGMLAVTIASPGAAYACGEKLLALGRAIRFQSRHTPRAASVLLYVPQNVTGQSLTDRGVESALQEAGHVVRAATTAADLEDALRTGGFDVVLSDVSAASELERAQAVVASGAIVLPAVYLVAPAQPARQAKADRDGASKAFGVMVEVPGRPGHYCAAVDKALDLKLKRERAASRRP